MYRLEVSDKLRAVMLRSERLKLPKGHILQSTEDARYFNLLVSGYTKRYLINNDGSMRTQVVYGPGDFFPITLSFSLLFDQGISESPEVYYYETMTNAVIYRLGALQAKDEITNDLQLYKDLLAVSGKRLHSTLHGLENLTLANSYHRVAHELSYMAERFGKTEGEAIKIGIPLTHQDIADILSLTRETVSTNMIQLRKKGLIKTGRGGIIVPNLEKLKAEAYGSI
jgi:CRP-like cAMP-binding protein